MWHIFLRVQGMGTLEAGQRGTEISACAHMHGYLKSILISHSLSLSTSIYLFLPIS